ncbi:MAG: porin [Bryobacterales bacterium]
MTKLGTLGLLVLVLAVAITSPAQQSQLEPGAGELLKRLDLLETRVRELEAELARLRGEGTPQQAQAEAAQPVKDQPQAVAAVTEAPVPAPRPDVPRKLPMAEVLPSPGSSSADFASQEIRMPISGYMDYHFNKPNGEPGTADFHRFVLLFGHSFNDRIQFWSELELEHALVEGGEPSGELELEQAYLDFRIKPWLNVRSGIMLTPVGLINERHEPPTFNGVERPFVDTVIIPTTWFEPGAGVFGDLGKGFTYKAYMMAPLSASRFNAEEGVREGRQRAFQAITQNPAFTGRLEYHGLPGLSVGASVWTGKSGFETPGINPRVNVIEFDGRFSVSRFDFRGEFAQVTLDQTERLNSLLQRTTGVDPNIAERMRGYYFEGAYHLLPPGFRHDFVVFSRYENFDTQNRMAPGYLPLREFDRDAFVSGFTYFPEPDVALKFDYSVLRNQSRFIQARNSLNLGIGWWF